MQSILNRVLQHTPSPNPAEESDAPDPQDQTEYLSRSILVMMFLVVVNNTLLTWRKKLSLSYPKLTKFVQDATITTLIGVIAGTLLHFLNESETLITIGQGYQNLFMIILLPPIIFESTLSMNKSSFFANFGSILVFAIVGTLMATVITAYGVYGASKAKFDQFTLGESFAFGSLISATDPVTVMSLFKEVGADKTLWSLIYGESILNDAIAITSYQVVTELATHTYEDARNPFLGFFLIFFGSAFLGYFIGMVCALFFNKYLGPNEDAAQSNTETITMIIVPWVAYLLGESFELSGIIAIMFCGISINKYCLPNMSESGRNLTHNLYEAISSTFENLAFMFIGIGFFSFRHDWEDLGVMIFVASFIIITAARFIQIYLLSWIINLFREKKKITRDFQAIIANSGFRGAMAFALATSATYSYSSDDSGSAILTLTLMYACFTIVVLGPIFMALVDRYDVTERLDSKDEPEDSGFSSDHCWNRLKRFFIYIDGYVIKFLVRAPKNETVAPSSTVLDDSAADHSAEKKVAFLGDQVIKETELTKIEGSPNAGYERRESL